jgi:hypothetical protein
LISAVRVGDNWQLPWPLETILGWLWQRWELEVAHREMKSGLGVGEKQCWNKRSAVVSVQWSVWVYAVLVLAGYRTWGLCGGPPTPAPWWPGAKRWSFNTLWRSYRAALWGPLNFGPFGSEPGPTGGKKKPGWPLSPTPSPLPSASEQKRALFAPFSLLLSLQPFLKEPNSRSCLLS